MAREAKAAPNIDGFILPEDGNTETPHVLPTNKEWITSLLVDENLKSVSINLGVLK